MENSSINIHSFLDFLSLILLQFSSLGSLDEKWMAELTSSMSAGLSEDKTPLGVGEPQIIWPTVEDVRCSLEVRAVVLTMNLYFLRKKKKKKKKLHFMVI